MYKRIKGCIKWHHFPAGNTSIYENKKIAKTVTDQLWPNLSILIPAPPKEVRYLKHIGFSGLNPLFIPQMNNQMKNSKYIWESLISDKIRIFCIKKCERSFAAPSSLNSLGIKGRKSGFICQGGGEGRFLSLAHVYHTHGLSRSSRCADLLLRKQ